MLGDWDIEIDGDTIIITHPKVGGVVVKKEGNDRIAADILAALVMDILRKELK